MIYEALSEEECYLLAILEDESGIDLAEFCLLDDTKQEWDDEVGDWVQGDGCFRCWPFQVPWWRNDEQKQIDSAARCLKEGTLIFTSDGYVPIQDVQVGQLVLTHKNRWRPVKRVFDNGVQDTVNIEGQFHPTALTVTAEHQFWGRQARRGSLPRDGHKRVKMGDPQWIKASDMVLRDGSQILSTRWSAIAEQVDPLPFIDALEPSYVSGQQNYVANLLTEDFMWLAGLYLAEGTTYIDNQFAKVNFHLHAEEVNFVEKKVRNLGLNCSTHFPNEYASGTIQLNSRPLAMWFKTYFQGTAREKEIAPWVFSLDENLRQAFLNGLVYGDGHIRPSGRIEYTTSSKKLALGVLMLGQTLGLHGGISYIPAPTGPTYIRGKQVYPGDKYSVGLSKTSNRIEIETGKAWNGITDISIAGKHHVYDIEVEEDHSYIAEGIIVHNSVGKSLSIKLRAFIFPFRFSNEEMVLTAPEQNHLKNLTDNVDTLFTHNILAREMLQKKGNGGITHRPWVVKFANGSKIMEKIPQRDGRGLKGMHPIWLEQDEGQDFPEPGWEEIPETPKLQNPRGRWRIHGVTRGVGDTFDEIASGEDSSWTTHRLPALLRPNWTEEEKRQKIKTYGGSADAIGYRRNVLGLPGDMNAPLFVLTKLMACVDSDDLSDYNQDIYFNQSINDAYLAEYDNDIVPLLDFPISHKDEKFKNYWIGMDIGFTNSPSCIVVFGEFKENKKDPSKMQLLSKIMLSRISTEYQVEAMKHCMNFYTPKAFGLDYTGAGLPVYDWLKKDVREDPKLKFMLDRLRNYGFSEKVVAGFLEDVEIPNTEDGWKEAAIMRGVIEVSTDAMRGLVETKRIILPFDQPLLNELRTVPRAYKSHFDQYGRSTRKVGMHVLDAMRMACLAHAQQPIEAFIDAHKKDIWEPPDMILG